MTLISKYLLVLFFVLFPIYLFAQDKSNQDYIEDLKSNDDAIVIQALQQLGKEQAEGAVDEIFLLLDQEKSYEVHANAIMAIGHIKKIGGPVNKLRDFLKKTEDRNLAYLVLAALINIADKDNPASKEALNVAEKRFKDDVYIQHACKTIRKLMN
jgi:hypothetical protein